MRLALITGATGGLGKALCYSLAKRKISLFLTATKEDALRELADSLKQDTSVEYFTADLASPSSRKELISLIHQKVPDLVINNAGFGLYGECLSHPSFDLVKLVEVDAIATMEITLEAARALASQKSPGTILNVSSAAAFFPSPYHAAYSASKAFVNNFSCAFAREVESLGIRILISCPGQIDTPFRLRASGGHDKAKTGHNIPVEKAAATILHQVDHGPTLRTFDLFYRLLAFASRFLPRRFLENRIASTLKKRFLIK